MRSSEALRLRGKQSKGLTRAPMGSGTTLQVAVAEGRKAVGIDIRQSQYDLTERRMKAVQMALPLATVAAQRHEKPA